jgi:hypothetical protein
LHANGKRELYDLRSDWTEKNNIISSNEEVAQRLHTILYDRLTKEK